MQWRRATITLGARAPSPAHRFIRRQTTGRVNQATSRQPANHSMSTRHDHPGSAGALAGPSAHTLPHHRAGQPSHRSPARQSFNGDAPRSPWERRRPRRPIGSYVAPPPGGSTKPPLASPPIIQCRRTYQPTPVRKTLPAWAPALPGHPTQPASRATNPERP